MSDRFWLRSASLVLLLGLAGCRPAITSERVAQIKLCQTTYQEVKELLGPPDQVGRLADRTTWRYNKGGFESDPPPKLLLIFDKNDSRVVDLAFNPPGLVELRDRCGN